MKRGYIARRLARRPVRKLRSFGASRAKPETNIGFNPLHFLSAFRVFFSCVAHPMKSFTGSPYVIFILLSIVHTNHKQQRESNCTISYYTHSLFYSWIIIDLRAHMSSKCRRCNKEQPSSCTTTHCHSIIIQIKPEIMT